MQQIRNRIWQGIAGLGWLFLLVVLSACSPQSANQAPYFSLPAISGALISLHDFKGQVALLNFWATWCAPCRQEVPLLESIYRKYRDQGFSVLGIAVDSRKDGIEAFIQEFQISYPIAMGDGKLKAIYKVKGVPESFLVNRQGVIVAEYIGVPTASDLERDIQRALAQK